jgi:formate dehydrogenase subunit gamma
VGTKVPSDRILRFRLSERLLHWAIAVPFLICFSTALVLVFYYNPLPTRPYRALVSLVHRVSGLCLIGLPPLVLLLGIRDLRTHWENVKEGWIWSFGDVKWLLLMPFAMLSKRVRLPEEGKFNAGEKLNFMWVMASWPLYGVTGALIWMGDDVERLIGVPLRLGVLPWIVHFSLAAVSTVLMSGHVFMAVVNPASRVGLSGMFGGYVSRHWASHHYRRWFKERFAALVEVSAAAPRAPDAVPELAPVAELSAARFAAPRSEPLPGVPLRAAAPAPAPPAGDDWEPDTDVETQPWLAPGWAADAAAAVDALAPPFEPAPAARVALTPLRPEAPVAAAPAAPVRPAAREITRPYGKGDLSLLEMMRSGTHAAVVSTIEHLTTGAHVAARTGVALTPAAVAFLVILAVGLIGGGVLAARLGLQPGGRPTPQVLASTMAPATTPASVPVTTRRTASATAPSTTPAELPLLTSTTAPSGPHSVVVEADAARAAKAPGKAPTGRARRRGAARHARHR